MSQKPVECLGSFPLPIEVIRFGWTATCERIEECLADNGFGEQTGTLRGFGGAPFVSDEGNYIVDYSVDGIESPENLAGPLAQIAGVVETGLFVGMCIRAIIGNRDGTVDFMEWRSKLRTGSNRRRLKI